MNTREKGTEQERLAAGYLEAQGMRIVQQNFRCRQGEIDLVGYHNAYLVFVEVKYRRTMEKGGALAAVDIRKQRRICRAAEVYLYRHGMPVSTPIRYDVIGIQGEGLEWIQNAFPHIYTRG